MRVISMKKQIANCITLLRIIGTFSLLFTESFSNMFFIIYTICGITDVLDGFVARVTNTSSEFGAKLDSAADLFFYAVMIVKVFPVLWDKLPRWLWLIALTAVAVRLASYLLAAIKYKRFASLHTYMNKFTGANSIYNTIFCCVRRINTGIGNCMHCCCFGGCGGIDNSFTANYL